MPKRYIRKYLPDSEQLRASGRYSWLERWLHHPNLWHLNRHSVAGGFAIGLFAGLVPGPFQMLVAALLAVPLKKNLPVALITTLYTNPFTIVPLYLLAFGYGRLLMGASHHPFEIRPYDWDWSHIIDSVRALLEWMVDLGAPLAVGLVALALTLAALGYGAVHVAWRAYVVRKWHARQRRRMEA